MIPDPTPVAGIWNRPRPEMPWLVIVTTESRTAATIEGRAGAGAVLFEPVDVVTLFAAAGAGVGAAVPCSGPMTRAVVAPVARIAARTAVATTVPMRRPPDPD